MFKCLNQILFSLDKPPITFAVICNIMALEEIVTCSL